SARRHGSTTRRARHSKLRPGGGSRKRLAILHSGHGFGGKALFAFIRTVSRQPGPPVLKVMRDRPDFLGPLLQQINHQAMRGPSEWSVGDRELMAAFVSKINACEY